MLLFGVVVWCCCVFIRYDLVVCLRSFRNIFKHRRRILFDHTIDSSLHTQSVTHSHTYLPTYPPTYEGSFLCHEAYRGNTRERNRCGHAAEANDPPNNDNRQRSTTTTLTTTTTTITSDCSFLLAGGIQLSCLLFAWLVPCQTKERASQNHSLSAVRVGSVRSGRGVSRFCFVRSFRSFD